MVISTLIPEILLFHFLYGNTFSNEEIKESGELPNPLGGESLPAIRTLKVRPYNQNTSNREIEINQEIEPIGAQRIFNSILSKFDIEDNKLNEEVNKLAESIQVTDSRLYRYDLNSGWFKKIDYKKSILLNEKMQVDSFEIRKK